MWNGDVNNKEGREKSAVFWRIVKKTCFEDIETKSHRITEKFKIMVA
jgi:hypothetical protein